MSFEVDDNEPHTLLTDTQAFRHIEAGVYNQFKTRGARKAAEAPALITKTDVLAQDRRAKSALQELTMIQKSWSERDGDGSDLDESDEEEEVDPKKKAPKRKTDHNRDAPRNATKKKRISKNSLAFHLMNFKGHTLVFTDC